MKLKLSGRLIVGLSIGTLCALNVNGQALTQNKDRILKASTNAIPLLTSITQLYDNGINVGVGVFPPFQIPAEKFHVLGNLRLENNTVGQQNIFNLKIGSQYANGFQALGAGTINIASGMPNTISDIAFSANGSNHQMVLKNTGSLGIGTHAPAAKLHVKGSEFRLERNDAAIQSNTLRVVIAGEAIANSPRLSGGSICFVADNPNQQADMAFSAKKGSYHLVLKNNGNVGVGLPNPTQTLDVNGNARIRSIAPLTPGIPPTNLVATDANGVLRKIPFPLAQDQVLFSNGAFGPLPTPTIPVSNGLEINNGDIQLGGSLVRYTPINLNGNSFHLAGSGKVMVGSFFNSPAKFIIRDNEADLALYAHSDKQGSTGALIEGVSVGLVAASTEAGGLGAHIGGHSQGLDVAAGDFAANFRSNGSRGIDLNVTNYCQSPCTLTTGINVKVQGGQQISGGTSIAVQGTNDTPTTQSTNYGGFFETLARNVGGAAPATNYGMYAVAGKANINNYGGYFKIDQLPGSGKGYAVYGDAQASSNPNWYAGYFNGKVAINGDLIPATTEIYSCGTSINRWKEIWAINGVSQTSDERMKTNIRPLNYGLKEVMKMKPVSFDWKENPANGTKLGFLAQDLEQIAKEVVVKGADDSYGVFYSDIIPILVNSIKEQQGMISAQDEKIEAQASEINAIKKELEKLKSATSGLGSTLSTTIQLLQNNPNPFSESTSINYILPENTASASILVFDMQGTLLKKMEITQKGKGNVTIHGNEFAAGMYLYSLVVDNKEIDTKRMILTK